MKKLFCFLYIFFPAIIFSQSVAINSDNSQPDNTALLDIKSSTKGLLIPRLTTTERMEILTPAVGLTVFDITTFSYWVYRGDLNGGWAELLHSFQKYWDISGSNIFNTNVGNIGIGTSTPPEKLTINATDPSIQFMNAGTAKGFVQASGNDMKFATYANNTTGNIILNTRAIDRMWITDNGLVGIGTSNPSAMLTINGTNPLLQMRTGDINKGYVQATGNDLKLGTNSTNTTGNLIFHTRAIDRMWINENGQVGIGTASPTSVLTVNGTEPVIQLRNGDVDKGFIQLVGSNIKIGTNLSNAFASFIVRTTGEDRMVVNYKGQVGIGVYPNDFNSTLVIDQDDNGNSGIDLQRNGFIGGKLSYNGTNTLLTSAAGYLGLFRSASSPFILHSDGNFSMGGLQKASGYKLSIHGRIMCTDDMTVMLSGSWPDYVFDTNYTPLSLADVRAYINKHKHLPNIPAAAEIEKSGIQLGDISKRLIEKVEELTLYILQLQEQINELKKNQNN